MSKRRVHCQNVAFSVVASQNSVEMSRSLWKRYLNVALKCKNVAFGVETLLKRNVNYSYIPNYLKSSIPGESSIDNITSWVGMDFFLF